MRLRLIFLLVALLSSGVPLKADDGVRAKAYLVADAHLDTQWNWDVQKTISQYVWNTLCQNLYLIRKYPKYIFNFEGLVKYSWMKEYYPDQYRELVKYIQEGRWHVAGCSWDANDVLVSSPESFFRNILLGQQFSKKEFGVTGKDIFLPDCFGFGWTLPTIANHCGLIGFSSQKLKWRKHPFYGDRKYPFPIGLWQGIDGSRIMMVHGHFYGSNWKEEDLSKCESILKEAKESPLNTVYRYYGTGDVGGAPSIISVRGMQRGVRGSGPVEIISATSDQLYKDYLPFDKHPELPVYDGELLMDVHGTGCYTSQAAMKLYNRQNEMLGNAAENAAAAADWLGATVYPRNLLTTAWQRFIWHQFHDDLTGTSIPRAYEFSWNDEMLSMKQFSDVLKSSVSIIADQMDTRGKGIPVVLANSNGYTVTNTVEMIIAAAKAPSTATVYNELGKPVPSQIVGYRDGKVHILAEATVPGSGYVVYNVRMGGNARSAVKATPVNTLENSVYRLTFDKNGDISSLFDKVNNRELVKENKAIRLAMFTENKSYAWPAWEILKSTVDQKPVSIVDGVKVTLVEDGKLRKSVCVEKKYGESVFRQYVRLYEGALADRVDFYNEIDWHSTNSLLKAEFPMSFSNEKATYDIGIGSVERGNNIDIAYEVYAQQWADLTAKDNSYGVSILNDSKYGWDKPDDNTIRLTLLHTPSTKRGAPYQNAQDFGFHTFTYSLAGHAGALDKPLAVMAADRLNRPLSAFVTCSHSGVMGKSFSFASSNNSSVVVRTLKKAEESEEYVVRVYEVSGKGEQKAEISFPTAIENASEAYGTEETIGKADFSDNRLQFTIRPFSVKTFKVKLKPCEKDMLINDYMEVPLKYDKKCFTWNEFRRNGSFEGSNSYAAELLPEHLAYNNVPFKFGDMDLMNGLVCKGDTIKVPAGHNRLYFLAAATKEGNHEVEFIVGDKKKKVTVPYYSGFIGQWGHSGHTEGFLNEAEVAYVGTHRHNYPEGDKPYEFTYMFKIGIDIPKGVEQIVLPNDKRVVIFSATAGKEAYSPLVTASELFRTANKVEK